MYKTLLPKRISKGDITIQKVSIENDNEIMNELINLFKKNAEHLLYWHHNVKEFLFRNTNDFKKHLEKNRLICYIVLKNKDSQELVIHAGIPQEQGLVAKEKEFDITQEDAKWEAVRDAAEVVGLL